SIYDHSRFHFLLRHSSDQLKKWGFGISIEQIAKLARDFTHTEIARKLNPDFGKQLINETHWQGPGLVDQNELLALGLDITGNESNDRYRYLCVCGTRERKRPLLSINDPRHPTPFVANWNC